MTNPLIRKLELFGQLPEADKRFLDEITSRPRPMEAHENLIREDDAPSDVHLVMEGFACRYKNLKDGSRHIFGYMLPGDFCDIHIFILKKMDHSIATLCPSTVVDIPRETILELLDRPAIARALWWVTLVDEATLREWLVNIGQRDAETRTAHLFCEMHARMKAIGLVSDGSFRFPITQNELADTMGMSDVHMNRSLQSLRAEGLIEFSGKEAFVPDVARLAEMSGFNPNYLHLEEGKADKPWPFSRQRSNIGQT